MKIWALTDDRMGNVNQVLGVAEALGQNFVQKNVRYNKFIRLPNFLRLLYPFGIQKESLHAVSSDFPDIVITAGRRAFPLALYIKRKSNNKTKIVQLMNPGFAGRTQADIVVLPAHDSPLTQSNILTVVGAPHRVTNTRLLEEHKKWEPVFSKYPTPRLSLIVGGATKNKPFTVEMAKRLVKDVLKLKPASILVTTSRRTPVEVVEYLKKHLPAKTFFYTFGSNEPNPYFGLLAFADEIVVTGDSISMCSECCAAGVPVYIFAPAGMVGEKHQRFLQTLYDNQYAYPLGTAKATGNISLNAAQQIATAVKNYLNSM